MVTKWSVPCPLPKNVTTVFNELQVRKTQSFAHFFFFYLCKFDICSLEAAGCCRKAPGLADEAQTGRVAASPEGKEVHLTSHPSGNDLWPFGIIQTGV